MGNCCSGDSSTETEILMYKKDLIQNRANLKTSKKGPSINQSVENKFIYKSLGEKENELRSFQSSINS